MEQGHETTVEEVAKRYDEELTKIARILWDPLILSCGYGAFLMPILGFISKFLG